MFIIHKAILYHHYGYFLFHKKIYLSTNTLTVIFKNNINMVFSFGQITIRYMANEHLKANKAFDV